MKNDDLKHFISEIYTAKYLFRITEYIHVHFMKYLCEYS
jgi:hypothetical protein